MPERPERILAVKLADLGDLLLCEPALRSLRTAFPAARIDVLVPPSSAALVPLLGHAVRTLVFPKQLFDDPRGLLRLDRARLLARLALRLRRARYTRVVLLHHLTTPNGARKFRALAAACRAPVVAGLDNGRGAFLTRRADDLGFGARHEADYMLAVARAAGGAAVDPAPRIAPPSVARSELPEPYLAIYPATGPYASARTWPAERYAEVARALADEGHGVVIAGGADAGPAAAVIRARVPEAVDLSGRTTLAELTGVIGGAAAVVGGDSFIGHLAAALDRPGVAIFGPSNDAAWRPYGAQRAGGPRPARRLVVRQDIPCAPCLYTGYALGRPDGCPTRTCLVTLPASWVVSAVRETLLKATESEADA